MAGSRYGRLTLRESPSTWADQRQSPGPQVAGPMISLMLLGGFELHLEGQVVYLPKTVRRLLVFLALRNHPLARTYVSQSLWLDVSERHADGNLRSALWKTGQVSLSLLDLAGSQLALGASVSVDHSRSVALARTLEGSPGSLDQTELNEEAFTEDLLPGWYEEWVLAERERYRQLRLHALEILCQELVSRRRFGQAVQAGLAAVAGEPLRESANLALIRAYLAEGNAGEAIRHFDSFKGLLWDQLGVAPSEELTHLIEDLSAR